MRYPTGLVSWTLIAVAALLLAGLLLSGGPHVPPNALKAGARTTELSVVAAIGAFQTEYDHLPGDRPDGRYEDASGNAEIFKVLRALDPIRNPRRIVYFEERNAKRPKSSLWHGQSKLRNGFDEQTGVLLDPFGNPYRIRMTASRLLPVSSPYKDAPAGENTVLVWSLGPDGKPGSDTDRTIYQGSDDILSWLPWGR